MNGESLIDLCQRVRPELACLGDLGQPLLDVITVIERVADKADVRALVEPAFALDVLAASGPTADAVVIGRVLDFLRQRGGAAPARVVATASPVTIAEAVEQYERGARLLAGAANTRPGVRVGAWRAGRRARRGRRGDRLRGAGCASGGAGVAERGGRSTRTRA